MANAKTRSEAAVLVLIVFLLGAIAGATANHLWGERVWGKQFGEVVDDTRAKIHADYSEADSQRDQLRLQGREKIRAILTPEQRPKFDELMRQLDEDRKKDPNAH